MPCIHVPYIYVSGTKEGAKPSVWVGGVREWVFPRSWQTLIQATVPRTGYNQGIPYLDPIPIAIPIPIPIPTGFSSSPQIGNDSRKKK
jgi:hypothetical protein